MHEHLEYESSVNLKAPVSRLLINMNAFHIEDIDEDALVSKEAKIVDMIEKIHKLILHTRPTKEVLLLCDGVVPMDGVSLKRNRKYTHKTQMDTFMSHLDCIQRIKNLQRINCISENIEVHEHTSPGDVYFKCQDTEGVSTFVYGVDITWLACFNTGDFYTCKLDHENIITTCSVNTFRAKLLSMYNIEVLDKKRVWDDLSLLVVLSGTDMNLAMTVLRGDEGKKILFTRYAIFSKTFKGKYLVQGDNININNLYIYLKDISTYEDTLLKQKAVQGVVDYKRPVHEWRRTMYDRVWCNHDVDPPRMCESYMSCIYRAWMYYKSRKVVSWSSLYEYLSTPCLAHVVDWLSKATDMTYEKNNHDVEIQPMEQTMMTATPSETKNLPPQLQLLVTDVFSHCYPEMVLVDEQEGALLDPLDAYEFRNAYSQVAEYITPSHTTD